MKSFFHTFLLLCIGTIPFSCIAQTYTSEKLKNTVWINEFKNKTVTLEFTTDSLIEIVNFKYVGTVRASKPYYLSNNKNEVFDNNRTGKKSSGKYLLDYNDKLKETEYCEIKELTADSLVLFYEFRKNHVGAADMYFTYKRIK